MRACETAVDFCRLVHPGQHECTLCGPTACGGESLEFVLGLVTQALTTSSIFRTWHALQDQYTDAAIAVKTRVQRGSFKPE